MEKQFFFIDIVNWGIVFLISIWCYFTIESIKYDQVIDFGLLESLILSGFIVRYFFMKKYHIEFYIDSIALIHAIFFGLFFIELFNQYVNNKFPTKIWSDSIVIVICYSLLILLRLIERLTKGNMYIINIFICFEIITNSMLNMIDPYMGKEYIDILRITLVLIIIRFTNLDFFINRTIVITMISGVVFGWFTYFGMVNGWMRFVGPGYGIPSGVKIVYLSILMISVPWLIFIGETSEKENFNKL